jgi:hypothetical protein
MLTQWRVLISPMGTLVHTGLDYSALPEVWRRTKTPPKDRDDVFDCLRVMEDAALEHIRATQKKD